MASAISPVTARSVVAAPSDWQAAVQNTYDHGTETDYSGLPLTRGLADIDAPTTASHHADYMNLWGARDGQGKFEFAEVTLVSEDWQLTGDKFHIDQWIFQADPDASAIRASHGFVDEDTRGTVLDTGYYKATDAESSAKLAKLTGKWSTFQPKAQLEAPASTAGVRLR